MDPLQFHWLPLRYLTSSNAKKWFFDELTSYFHRKQERGPKRDGANRTRPRAHSYLPELGNLVDDLIERREEIVRELDLADGRPPLRGVPDGHVLDEEGNDARTKKCDGWVRARGGASARVAMR